MKDLTDYLINKNVKKCTICGKHFQGNSSTAKYCSRDCRDVIRRAYTRKKYKEQKNESIHPK